MTGRPVARPVASRATRVVARLAFVLATGALCIAIWIVVPAPTMMLLAVAIAATELSHWLIVISVAAVGLAIATRANSRVLAAMTVGAGATTVALALVVWLQIGATIARFSTEMAGLSATPSSPLRTAPIVATDLFRFLPTGAVRATIHRLIAAPSGESLFVDVVQPKARGTYPIVVQIYAGAWRSGEPSNNADFAEWLAASGYVVFAIDHRHAPAFHWPAQIDDVDDALRWVAAHAGEYEGDSTRIALVGRSSGGHLATYAAWVTAPIAIRGVVSFYGPADLADAYRHPPSPDPLDDRTVERMLMGGPLEAMPARYDDASTIPHLRALGHPVPPTLLIYGGMDHIVDAKYGARLAVALRATGSAAAFLEIPWAEHSFDAVFNGPSSQLSLYYIERFLAYVTAVHPGAETARPSALDSARPAR